MCVTIFVLFWWDCAMRQCAGACYQHNALVWAFKWEPEKKVVHGGRKHICMSIALLCCMLQSLKDWQYIEGLEAESNILFWICVLFTSQGGKIYQPGNFLLLMHHSFSSPAKWSNPSAIGWWQVVHLGEREESDGRFQTEQSRDPIPDMKVCCNEIKCEKVDRRRQQNQ